MTLTAPARDVAQRRTESPHLWGAFVLSSLFIHGLVLGIIHWWVLRQQTVQLMQLSTPIDLVAVPPQILRETQPPLRQMPSTESILKTAKTLPAPRNLAQDSINQTLPASSEAINPNQRQTPVNSAEVDRKRISARASMAQAGFGSQQGFPQSTPSTAVPNPSVSTTPPLSESQSGQNFGSQSPASTAAPGLSAHQTPATQASPPASTSSDTPAASESETLPSAPPAPTEGRGVMATVVNVSSGNGGRDEPQQLARPRQEQKQFPSIDYPLPIEQTTGQPIILRALLLIDNTGNPKVISARVESGETSFNAVQFVKELVQNWQFDPAYKDGGAVYSQLEVLIQISPLSN